MAYIKINNVSIKGVAAAVPKDIKEIKNLSFFSEGEAEKVIGLTHIERSRIARPGLECSDLCFEAADNLIKNLQWDRSEIEALIYVSLSRDYPTPPTSALLQDRLGLPTECFSIDIPLACSGYVYGLSTISSILASGGIKKAILLVGETTSRLQSPLDKTLYPLHGDAGTATALEFEESAQPMYFHLCTDGKGAEAIINRDGGTRNPFTPNSLEMKEIESGVSVRGIDSVMDGMAVFKFSTKNPPMAVTELNAKYNLSNDDINYFLVHQANQYIDEKIAKKLKIDANKMPFCLSQFGNTSSATIPMTIVTKLADKLPNENSDVLMLGFGSGLSWGAARLHLNHIICVPLIEVE